MSVCSRGYRRLRKIFCRVAQAVDGGYKSLQEMLTASVFWVWMKKEKNKGRSSSRFGLDFSPSFWFVFFFRSSGTVLVWFGHNSNSGGVKSNETQAFLFWGATKEKQDTTTTNTKTKTNKKKERTNEATWKSLNEGTQPYLWVHVYTCTSREWHSVSKVGSAITLMPDQVLIIIHIAVINLSAWGPAWQPHFLPKQVIGLSVPCLMASEPLLINLWKVKNTPVSHDQSQWSRLPQYIIYISPRMVANVLVYVLESGAAIAISILNSLPIPILLFLSFAHPFTIHKILQYRYWAILNHLIIQHIAIPYPVPTGR